MNIRFLKLAQQELDDAFEWYEEQLPGLGLEFLDEVDRAIRRITAWPQSCNEIVPGIRRCLVRRYPYGIVILSPNS